VTNHIVRHVPVGTIAQYVDNGISGAFEVSGAPTMTVTVDPEARALTLRTAAGDRIADVGPLQRVRCREVLDGAVLEHVVEVSFDDDLEEIYALLCTIADRVQLSGESFAGAIEGTLEALSALLERRAVPSIEQQIGLAGELLVLLSLAKADGLQHAIDCWRGPRGEEHDFGTKDADIEVKTTLGEQRSHWITSNTQLTPTGNRPLYLVSIQLTRAAASKGWTLPDLVDRLRGLATSAQPLTDMLKATVYSDRTRDLMTDRWTLRNQPAAFEITPSFPAVTRARLLASVPNTEHIVEFRYRLDLSGLPEAVGIVEFTGVVQPGD
jgi:hypothetical protein